MSYDHLGLTRWPFPVVPERSFCTFIADRSQLKEDVEGLLRTWVRQDSSSIHLLWSWFGAGKTHTLFYIANRAVELRRNSPRQIHTFYSEFPKAAKSFLDLYRAFAHQIDTESLIEAYLEISTSPGASQLERELMSASPDLVSALRVMVTAQAGEQLIAGRWLRGDSLPVAQFRSIGVSQKIASSEDAGRILTALIHLLTLAARSKDGSSCRVVWLLDEFQRIERLPPRVREEINTGLHSSFNASPTGFSIVLSFSGRPGRDLPAWFSPELKDRIGRTKVLILPPMQPVEALGFVKDIIAHHRTLEGYYLPTFHPFTEESSKLIIDDIAGSEELKPRAIMHAFNAVLQEADLKLETSELDNITPQFAKQVLAERVPLSEQEEE